MKQWLSRRIIGLLALLVALAMVNLSVFQKEQQLAHGKVVYLDLAPVDPRSLMQGDYMTLSFAIGQEIRRAFGTQCAGIFQRRKRQPITSLLPSTARTGRASKRCSTDKIWPRRSCCCATGYAITPCTLPPTRSFFQEGRC
ncbi:MAG: GDYXXLXY domain-containing protein [Marinobacter sp.]|nr:GDYXXLXY domain-containing protein [Marinobacter sp.]